MIPGVVAGQMRTAVSPGLLLDLFPGAILALSSSRRLRSAYSGSCIRVRRLSDNAEQDIGFLGDQLDTAALTTFCSATEGRVVTWYDQSGSGANAVQATWSRAPTIYLSGAVQTINSTPALYFPGDRGMITSSGLPWPTGTDESMTLAMAYRVVGSSLAVLLEAGYPSQHLAVPGALLFDVNDSSGSLSVAFGGSGGTSTTSYGSAPQITRPYNRMFKGTWRPGGATTAAEFASFNLNNVAVTPGTIGTPASTTATSQFNLSPWAIGARMANSTLFLNGHLGEIIVYPGTTYGATAALDLNVMSQYGIP